MYLMDRIAWVREMEDLAPPGLAEEFDSGRIGLIIEGRRRIGTVCCALDATPAVVRTAIDQRADMLVVHHTPFWTPLTSLTGGTATFAREVLSADMNLYVMHTNFDFAPGGVNDSLAELLGLSHRVHMSYGLVGTCTISLPEIASRLRTPLRIWGRLNELHHLAIAAGSGFDPGIIGEAADLGAGGEPALEEACQETAKWDRLARSLRLGIPSPSLPFLEIPPTITLLQANTLSQGYPMKVGRAAD